MALSRSLGQSCGTLLRHVQYSAGKNRKACVLSTLQSNIQLSTLTNRPLTVFHKTNIQVQDIVFSNKLKDPRIILSVLQSTDASALQNNKEVVSTSTSNIEASEKDKAEYDKLYRSILVECRGNDKAVLKSYSEFVSFTAKHLHITLESTDFPRYHLRRWTLLKSVHIHKKHRVQYEVRSHFLIMKFLRLTSSTADTFLEYIQRNLPEGVAMIVSKEELMKLPQYVKGSDKAAP